MFPLIRTGWPTHDRIPVFRPGYETATGGFKLNAAGLVVGSVISAGAPVSYNEITRIATLIKTGVLASASLVNDVVLHVNKGSAFIVGDYISAALNGQASHITAIDPSNANYDSITVDVALGVLAQGAGLFQAAGASTNASVEVAPAMGLLKTDYLADGGSVLVDIVIRGTVYARRIPLIINGLQTKLSRILFSNSQ